MNEKMPPNTIGPRARDAACQLRAIAAFLSQIDALEAEDVPGWEFMGTRFFIEERAALLDVADLLECELAPEAEKYAGP